MSKSTTIELPRHLQLFVEERVRQGQNASVAEVICEALEEKKLAPLRTAIAVGIAQLDAGLCIESSLEEFIARHAARVGITL